MELRRQMREAVAARKEDAIVAHKRFKEQSRTRLMRIIETKLKTTLIGSVSRFEGHFGRTLWGHGLPEEQLTEAQKQWREVWNQCRNEVLNNGNQQLRALEKEIINYDIEWLRYQNDLPIKPQPEGGPHE